MTNPTAAMAVAASVPYNTPMALTVEESENLRKITPFIKVLVIGSLNVDYLLEVDGHPEDDGTLLVRSTTVAPGGHAGNCASALSSLGMEVSLVSAIGLDHDGDMLIQDLDSHGISSEYITRYDGKPTGRVYIPLFHDSHYMLMERGANELLTAHSVQVALKENWDAVVVFDPSITALLALFEAMSWLQNRPKLLWTPGGVYAQTPVVESLAPVCDTIFVNSQEYAYIKSLGVHHCTENMQTEIVQTLGARGAMLIRHEGPVKVTAPCTNSIDPTGAGDTFAAAYLLASISGLSPVKRLMLANHAGAMATSSIGARGMQPTLEMLIDAVSHVPTDAVTTISANVHETFLTLQETTT